MSEVLLKIRDLQIDYKTDLETVHAVNGVSLTLNKGETLGLVGETGAGKTTTALSIMGLLPERTARTNRGSIWFDEQDILAIRDKDGAAVSEEDYIASHVPETSEGETLEAPAVEVPAPAYLSNRQLQAIRGEKISMIFQDPMTSLNPVYKIGKQVGEGLRLHRGYSKQEALKRATELLDLVGIPEPEKRVNEYPHQFSGGMRQRVMIAMALACDPDILIADEPTTALDVTIQAQIIELMQEMQEKNGNAIIMITHDLGVVADMADKIMVMYGRPVEFGTAEEIFYESRHPYTWGLIRSIPEQAIDEKKPLTPIHGNPPSLMNLPEGCVFSPRCPYATDKCRKQRPERVVTESGHYSACHYSGDPEFLKNAPETSRTRKDSKKGGEA